MSTLIQMGDHQFLEVTPDQTTGRIVVRRKDPADGTVYAVQHFTPAQCEKYAMALWESLLELAVVDAEMSWKKACPVMQGFHPLGKVGAPL